MRDYADLEGQIASVSDRIYRLNVELSALRKEAGRSWIEERRDPTLMSMTARYEPALDALIKAIDGETELLNALIDKRPCKDLIHALGLQFHEFYRLRHPINKDTRVFKDVMGHPVIHYQLADELAELRMDAMPSPVVVARTGEAKFERFAYTCDGAYILYEIAYAPEINTLWYRKSYL